MGIKKAFLFVMCVAILLPGCGYTTSSIVSEGSKTICVADFANKINLTMEVTDKRMYTGYRSGMEVQITNQIINRFLLDGHLKIADSSNADLLLEGSLVDFKREALRYDSADNIIEYRIKVIIDMKLTNLRTNAVIFEEKNFTGETTYRTTGTLTKSEDTAIRDAELDLAQRVVEKVIEGW